MPGIILKDVKAADESILGRGEAALSKARDQLFKATLKQSKEMQALLTPALQRIEKGIQDGMLADGTGIKAKELKRTIERAEVLIHKAVLEADFVIRDGIELSVSRAVNAQTAHLKKLGLK